MIGRFMEMSGEASISIERKWRLDFWLPVRGFEFPGRGKRVEVESAREGMEGGIKWRYFLLFFLVIFFSTISFWKV